MEKDYEYAGIKIPVELKKAIKEIAEKERRSFGKQALIILEIGLREYTRDGGPAVTRKDGTESSNV
jgi:hypothetical protein